MTFHRTFSAAVATLATLAGVLVTAPGAGARPAAASTVGVGQYPYSIDVDPGTHTAYVLNEGNDQAENGNGTLSIITGATVQTRKVGGTPVAAAVDPTTHTVYVAVANTQSSLLIVSPGRTRRIAIGDPVDVAVDPGTATVWVLEVPRTLVAIHDGTQTSYALGGDLPFHLALDAQHHVPYVLSPDGTLDSVSNGRVFAQHLSAQAAAVAVDPSTGTVYVAHSAYFAEGVQHPALVSELSGFNLRLVDLGYQFVGGLAVNSTTHTALVSEYNINNAAYGQLAMVTGGRVRQHTVGGTPGAVAVDQTDSAACVVNTFDGTASIVQGSTVQTVATGRRPVAAATDDSAGVCYVANLADNTVSELPLP